MSYAVIQTGGKQYKVTAGEIVKVEKLENQVRGMISKIDEISEKSSKTKHVDLVEDVGTEIEGNKKEKDGKKKTDNEGDAKSSKQPDSKSGKSNKKSV